MSGITGLRRCSTSLREPLEDPDVEEAELDTDEEEPAGVRVARDALPAGAFDRWARSEGLGAQTSFCLFNWAALCPGRKGEKNKKLSKWKTIV